MLSSFVGTRGPSTKLAEGCGVKRIVLESFAIADFAERRQEQSQTARDQGAVPSRAVLILEGGPITGFVEARRKPRRMESA
jgi:hypothetical protein